MKGVFITGTDTGIGKTVVTATLCRILRKRGLDVVALKPFATGLNPYTRWQDNDPLLLSAAMDYAEQPETISSVRLSDPLSPYDAARISGTILDLEAVTDSLKAVAERHSYVIIEGVGGVAVPLTEEIMVSDFIERLDLSALVIARSAIGTINHSLLTIAALRQKGVCINGLLFMRAAAGDLSLDEKLGPETTCRLGKVKSLGLVEYSEGLRQAETIEEFVQALPVDDSALISVAESLMTDIP